MTTVTGRCLQQARPIPWILVVLAPVLVGEVNLYVATSLSQLSYAKTFYTCLSASQQKQYCCLNPAGKIIDETVAPPIFQTLLYLLSLTTFVLLCS